MISLLLRDSWKILRNPVAIFQELDKDKTKIIDSKWIVDKEMANRSELSEELANFCPQYIDISGENDGRLIDFYKGWDRRWVKDREVWNAYTEKKQKAKLRSRFPYDFY